MTNARSLLLLRFLFLFVSCLVSNPAPTFATTATASSNERNAADLRQTQLVRVQLNGLTALTEKILPIAAQEAGLNDIQQEFAVPTQQLMALGVVCYELDLNLVFQIHLPIESNSVRANFTSGLGLKTNWDLDDANVELAIHTQLRDMSNNVACWGWDLASFLATDNNTVGAKGLGGMLNVHLQEEDSRVTLAEIEEFTLAFREITVTSSSFLNWLIDLGMQASEIFDSHCDSTEACVNLILNNELKKENTQRRIVKALNRVLGTSLAISGGMSPDGQNIDYAVALKNLATSESNALRASWDIDLSTLNTSDPCAIALERAEYETSEAAFSNSDINISIPFAQFIDAAYLIGQQGVFCANIAGNISTTQADGEVRYAGGSFHYNQNIQDHRTPFDVNIQYRGALVPNGVLDLRLDEAADTKNTVYILVPFRVDFNATASIAVNVNSEFSELSTIENASNDVLETQEIRTSSTLSGVLEISTRLDVDCNEGLYLNVESVKINDISGSLHFGDTFISGTELTSSIENAMAEHFNQHLPYLTILPKVTDVTNMGGLGVEINEVVLNETSLGVGINIVTADEEHQCL